jgi:anti-sigma regulatory factor (Ser/Thr protein kinase)
VAKRAWTAQIAMQTALDLSLPAVPLSVGEARQAVAEVAAETDGSQPGMVEDVRLCVSEAVANVVRHAYDLGQGDVSITVVHANSELTVIVRDDGVGMSGFQREGELGHGLRIIDQLTRRFAITSAPNLGTELRMVFPLEAGAVGLTGSSA